MKRLLRNVYDFFIRQRQSGTSTLLKKVAAENDVWILVPNEKMKEEFGPQAIDFYDLQEMMGTEKKPILVDNYTMIRLCEEFHLNISELQTSLHEKSLLLDNIERLIRDHKHNRSPF